MIVMNEVKQEVRHFYNQIGWQLVDEDLYQNARYEDLRPVSQEYLHRCHLRVSRYLKPDGRYFLDAGSGPIQYPDYLLYSRGYRYRVCADISITALREARKRIGNHGLFVVSDIANLPFKAGIFEGEVSLHTIHHLPRKEHLRAYKELHRVLAPDCTAAVVNSWSESRMMNLCDPLIRATNRLRGMVKRLIGTPAIITEPAYRTASDETNTKKEQGKKPPKGTFTARHDVAWVKDEVGAHMPVEIYVWRSVSVRFTRALIHPSFGGRYWLRLLFWLEDRFPHYFGENGQYPIIFVTKNKEAPIN